jgi:hypothetical protein
LGDVIRDCARIEMIKNTEDDSTRRTGGAGGKETGKFAREE